MIELSLAFVEIVLVCLGICLLYWWTSRETVQANTDPQSAFTASEDDYLNHMIETSKSKPSLQRTLLQRQVLSSGKLTRTVLCEMKTLIVYYSTRVMIQQQNFFR